MPKITYIESNDTRHVVEVRIGQSLMEGAMRNNVPGIEAECGGACSCGTCHVYVDPQWLEKLDAQDETERALLEFNEAIRDNSRLACQIRITDALDGLVVHIPKSEW